MDDVWLRVVTENQTFYIIYHTYPTYPMQELVIFLIFAAALAYLGNRAYQNFSAKKTGCGKGCGCATDANASIRSAEK